MTFTCEICGRLLKDCADHNPVGQQLHCVICGGELRRVGTGTALVEFAVWFRCLMCERLLMLRRNELVETKPRSGFSEYA